MNVKNKRESLDVYKYSIDDEWGLALAGRGQGHKGVGEGTGCYHIDLE